MNAVMLTEEEMRGRISNELMHELGGLSAKIDSVYFYGAGCISAEVCGNVASAIKANIPSATKVEVYTDLLAAARALCGREPGIACIMGTGSNSCLYDGRGIAHNVSPLGCVLGDEGSGAVLGKLFLGDVLKNQLPADAGSQVPRRIQPRPPHNYTPRVPRASGNRFMASVTPFHKQAHRRASDSRHGARLVQAFFRRNIMQYEGYSEHKVNFIGSIAVYFRPCLKKQPKNVAAP